MAKIMIVDDSNLIRVVISNFVKKAGSNYEIVTAQTGEEAIEKYQSEKPDLVFMDIKMPGMDGISAMEKIRASDPNAKVVMCTALKEPEQEERAKKAGCVDYIVKPFNKEEIINVLKQNVEG